MTSPSFWNDGDTVHIVDIRPFVSKTYCRLVCNPMESYSVSALPFPEVKCNECFFGWLRNHHLTIKAPPLVERAALFAWDAHSSVGQTRKYTGEHYIEHPRAVAQLVKDAGGDEAMICAAWLHDVVEDCGVTMADVFCEFGMSVGDLVYWLTDKSNSRDGNREARKAIDRAHIAMACDRAKAVKLADLIDNTASIVEHDPNFAVVYLKEKAALLEVLADAADLLPAAAILLARARQTVADGLADIGKPRAAA